MQTTPVIDLYRRFGKVREVSGEYDELMVYENTRKAMLPQVSFIIGPQASGKTTLGAALCERTNQRLINFNEFVSKHKI
jgi:adenylate kinase family enzyme